MMKLFNRDREIKKPNKQFDGNGLRYDVKYLKKVFKRVIFLPLEEQAQFVDKITYMMYKDPLYKPDKLEPVHFGQLNTTSIGNLAFLACHHPDEEIKNYSINTLEMIKVYFKEKP